MQSGILLQKKRKRLPVNTPRRSNCTNSEMPPAKRKSVTAVVPRTPERRIDLSTLPVASPKTGERAPTSMRRSNLPAFVCLGNVRQTESGDRRASGLTLPNPERVRATVLGRWSSDAEQHCQIWRCKLCQAAWSRPCTQFSRRSQPAVLRKVFL